MTFNFNKATALINELSRPAFGWLFTKQNKFRKVVNAGQHYQGNPADGGIYGLLVSSDTTHGRLF
ncbi:MAG: hypothetical protein ACLQHK_14220 [Gallionellaceae bacterium]